MYELAKKSREAMKSKARRLAAERDEKVDSSDWSPAPLLRAEIKTGARPIMKPSAKGIGESNAARDTKAAIGDAKRGAFKSGGAVKDAGIKDKKALGAIDPSPKRGPAGHYKKGGRVKKADGGILDTLANALAGRGYIDDSTWLPQEAAMTASDEAAAPVRRAAAVASRARPAARPKARVERESPALTKEYALQERYPYIDETISGAEVPMQSGRFIKGYKKGGKIKRADGGQLPDPYEAMRSEERLKGIRVEPKRDRRLPSPQEAAESAARVGDVPEGRKAGGKKWIAGAIKKPGALHKQLGVPKGEKIPAKKLAKAAEKGGKLGQRARLAQTLGKLGKKKGGAVTGLTVVIADKRDRGQQAPILPGGPMMRGVPMPLPGAMGASGPGPTLPPGAVGGTPPMAAPPPAQMPLARKAGGRITKVASSYKDMEAGAASGEGKLQKTDIAKLHKGAPTRKTGGRISKIASSYKDMEAGSGTGFGRLQKTSIAEKRKGAPTA